MLLVKGPAMASIGVPPTGYPNFCQLLSVSDGVALSELRSRTRTQLNFDLSPWTRNSKTGVCSTLDNPGTLAALGRSRGGQLQQCQRESI